MEKVHASLLILLCRVCLAEHHTRLDLGDDGFPEDVIGLLNEIRTWQRFRRFDV
jgi:hypothetical protein